MIASLVRRFGDIDLAEEAAGDSLVAALEKWPSAVCRRTLRDAHRLRLRDRSN